MSRGTQIALIVGLLVLAGGIYYLRAGNVNDLTSNREVNAHLQCAACQKEFDTNLDVADIPPFACEQCGKKEAWPVWECGKCQHRFTPAPEGQPPRQPMMPKCPKCGSTSTGRTSAGE